MNDDTSPRQSILRGIARIARGRADGVGCFAGTPQAFMASLAPLLAFPLVGAGMALFTEGPRRALTGLAVALCALLTPAVISYELARFWKRAEAWLRFATAFNWCEWILPFVACLVMVPLSIAINAGMREAVASSALVACLVTYGLWLHWFLARKALGLSGRRAALLVLLVNLGTAVAVVGPHLLASQIA